MKEFNCGDIVAGCGAHFRAGSASEIVEVVRVHARIGHGLDADHLPAGFTTQVAGLVRDVAA